MEKTLPGGSQGTPDQSQDPPQAAGGTENPQVDQKNAKNPRKSHHGTLRGDPKNLEKIRLGGKGKYFEGPGTPKEANKIDLGPFFLNFVTRVREPSIV